MYTLCIDRVSGDDFAAKAVLQGKIGDLEFELSALKHSYLAGEIIFHAYELGARKITRKVRAQEVPA